MRFCFLKVPVIKKNIKVCGLWAYSKSERVTYGEVDAHTVLEFLDVVEARF